MYGDAADPLSQRADESRGEEAIGSKDTSGRGTVGGR